MNMVISSASLDDEWTLSVSRGYGEAAARARIWLGRRCALSAGLPREWFGGDWPGETSLEATPYGWEASLFMRLYDAR